MLKLGRHARKFNPNVPHRDSLTLRSTSLLEPAPVDKNYLDILPDDLGMMGNDTMGLCTDAGYYHGKQVWTKNASGIMVTEPTSNVIQLYSETTGWKIADGGEGPGANEQDVLSYLIKTGAPMGPAGQDRHKLTAFFEVDPAKQMDVQYEINACGVVYIGFNVPAFLMAGPPPAFWDLQPGRNVAIIGGHCVILGGYDWQGVYLISWGKKYKMSWEFFAAYVDEVYPLVDEYFVTANGTTPGGLTIPEWKAEMELFKAA